MHSILGEKMCDPNFYIATELMFDNPKASNALLATSHHSTTRLVPFFNSTNTNLTTTRISSYSPKGTSFGSSNNGTMIYGNSSTANCMAWGAGCSK